MLENVNYYFYFYFLFPMFIFLNPFLTSPSFFLQLRRIKATTNTYRELPSITMGGSADDFFVALDQDTAQGKTLPNWCVPLLYTISDGPSD
jgi:hypothetical protein